MSSVERGYVFWPRGLEFLVDAYEAYSGGCSKYVYREALSRLVPQLSHTPKLVLTSRRSLVEQPSLGGLSARVSNGLLEVILPPDTENVATQTPMEDRVYLPRDCDVLFVHTGRTCLGLITSDLRLEQATRFETIDVI